MEVEVAAVVQDLKLKNLKMVEDKSLKDSKPIRRRYDEAFDEEQEEEDDFDQPSNLIGNQLNGIVDLVSDASNAEEAVVVAENIICQLPSCPLVFTTTKEYQKHYNSRHMHACGSCRKSLPSAHILELHVLELHDTLFSLMAERKPMFQCFLETCVEKFQNPDQRKIHCMTVHNFPERFRFWQIATPITSESLSNSGRKNERKPRQNKNNANLKADLEDVSPSGATVSELPDVVPESDLSAKQEKLNSQGKESSGSKSKPIHIAFGHTPHQMFKKNYTFGLPKSHRKPGTLGKRNSKPETKDDGMDLSEIQEALSTSALVLGLVDPKP